MQWRVREPLKALLLGLLVLPVPGLAAEWFQVEVIVFKPYQAQENDEVWPLESLAYPANMVSVADTAVRPFNLSQVEYLSDSGADTTVRETQAGNTTFLFEGRGSSQYNRRVIEALNQESAQETQAASGLPETGAPITVDQARIDSLINEQGPQAFAALATSAHAMSRLAGSLRRSSRYQLVKHQAWLQPLDDKPVPILLQTGERYADKFEIDGTLSFSRSRFLHLEAQLWYTQFESRFNQGTYIESNPDLDRWQSDYPDLVEAEKNRDTHVAVHSHLLRHSRRMRSEELHYIDHPYFGILVWIQDYQAPAAPGAE